MTIEDHQEFGVPVGKDSYGTLDPAESKQVPEATGVPASDGLRLMAVHAHPDDESSKGAAMMAAYEEAGAEVMVVLCTSGEAGSLLNPNYRGEVARLERDITAVRRKEMETASKALGIDYVWLGYLDSGLPEGDPLPELAPGVFATVDVEYATAALVRTIRAFKPHVIISYDEIGGYPHPDHLRAHEITVKAYRESGDPEKYPGTGEPWTISKLYYDRAFNPEKYRALHQAFIEAGQDSPYANRIAWYDRLESGEEDPGPFKPTQHKVTTRIPIGAYLEKRDAALRAHATQVDPEGNFFAAPNELLRRTWPWEDYVLIDSRVVTTIPETDLFSGLRDQTDAQAQAEEQAETE